MATLADIAQHVKNLKENDPVVLKLIHRGHFRAINGFMKAAGTIPSMVTEDGQLLIIRPVMILDGQTYEYSSIAKETKHGY